MKIIKKISVISLLLMTFLWFSSCSDAQTTDKGPEFTSEYVCPMHCEGSGSHEPGTCPTCHMKYEKNEHKD